MSDPLLRQLVMLRLVPRHPRALTAAELRAALEARGYRIHERSVQRDLARLSEVLPLISSEGRPLRWSWQPHAESFEIPAMDPSTALAWELLDRHVAPLLPPPLRARFKPHAARAAEVLRLNADSGYGRWKHKIAVIPRGQPLLAPSVRSEVFDAVQNALFDNRQLRGSYRARSHGDEPARERKLHPLGLVMREQLVYLVAHEGSGAPIKQFALHRFGQVEVLDTPVSRPKGFDFDRYVSEQRGLDLPSGRTEQIVLDVAPLVAQHLAECRLAKDQVIVARPDGSARVTATLPITEQLLWWVLGHGGRVVVRGPEVLVERWREAMRPEMGGGSVNG
jgi:predicted DNA-binding transcriptional regulator YafY